MKYVRRTWAIRQGWVECGGVRRSSLTFARDFPNGVFVGTPDAVATFRTRALARWAIGQLVESGRTWCSYTPVRARVTVEEIAR